MVPCVMLGRARPTDRLCDGCRYFCFMVDDIVLQIEQEAADRAERAARR